MPRRRAQVRSTASSTRTPQKGEASMLKRKLDLSVVCEKSSVHSTVENADVTDDSVPIESPSLSRPSKRTSKFSVAAQSPLVISPTGTLSTASSPDTVHGTWASLFTPSRESTPRSLIEALTPLTAPSTSDSASSASLEDDASPSRRTTCLISSKKLLSYTEDGKLNRDTTETADDDDEFIPKKLFRNLTKELENISKAAASVVQGHFNPKPLSFDFTDQLNTGSSTSVRRSPRIAKTIENARVPVTTDCSIDKGDRGAAQNLIPCAIPKDVLLHIIPLNMKQLLKADNSRCVASLVKNSRQRCRWSRKSTWVFDKLDPVFETIKALYKGADYHDLIDIVRQATRKSMCGNHINSSERKMRKLENEVCTSDCQKKEGTAQQAPAVHGDTNVKSTSKSDLPSTRKASNVTNTQKKKQPPVSDDRGSKASTNAGPNSKIHLKAFIPYQPKAVNGMPVKEALLEQIEKPLGVNDKNEGYIYMFWDKEHFGKVKIGHTKDLKRRLKEWNKTCNRDHSYHKTFDSGAPVWIPHRKRVELLIHTELKESRLKRLCECGVRHQEWFAENENHAVRVLRKWEEWILQEPYALDPKTNTWKIRPEMRDTLDEVCTPVPREERRPAERRRSSGVKTNGKSAKRSPRRTM